MYERGEIVATSMMDSIFQGSYHKLFCHTPVHGYTDDLIPAQIHDSGKVEPAFIRRDVFVVALYFLRTFDRMSFSRMMRSIRLWLNFLSDFWFTSWVIFLLPYVPWEASWIRHICSRRNSFSNWRTSGIRLRHAQ